MAAPLAVTAPSSIQNLMNIRQDDSMVSRGVMMIETTRPSVSQSVRQSCFSCQRNS